MTPLHLASKNGALSRVCDGQSAACVRLRATAFANRLGRSLSTGYNRMVRRLVTEYGALIDAMTLVSDFRLSFCRNPIVPITD